MIHHYDGQIPSNAVLVLDVAGEAEKTVLIDKILLFCYTTNYDTYGILLRLLTSLPVLTTAVLSDAIFTGGAKEEAETATILFTDLHLGMCMFVYLSVYITLCFALLVHLLSLSFAPIYIYDTHNHNFRNRYT